MHETPFGGDPDARLERALMEEYLADRGHSFDDLASFDDDRRQRLLLEAAVYAALRLGERAYLETRAGF
jgi:hypothetical protein